MNKPSTTYVLYNLKTGQSQYSNNDENFKSIEEANNYKQINQEFSSDDWVILTSSQHHDYKMKRVTLRKK